MTNLFNMRPSTNYDYKHNDMKWNIIDKHLHIWRMMMKMVMIMMMINLKKNKTQHMYNMYINISIKSMTAILTATCNNGTDIHMIWGKI